MPFKLRTLNGAEFLTINIYTATEKLQIAYSG